VEELKRTGMAEVYLSNQPFVEEMRQFYSQQGNRELETIKIRYGGAFAQGSSKHGGVSIGEPALSHGPAARSMT
jgi:hypothetical protein